MDGTQKIETAPEEEAERFPAQMLLVPDVFTFSFAEANALAKNFGSNGALFGAMVTVAKYIETAELPADDRETLAQLLHEEIEVMSYTQTSRSSVISL